MPAGRSEVRRSVTYTYYEQLNGYTYLKRARHRLFLLRRLLCGRHPEGARSDREDDHPHPVASIPVRARRTSIQGSRAHHRRAWAIGKAPIPRLAFSWSRHRYGGGCCGLPIWSMTMPSKRDRVSAALKDPRAEEQPRSRRHHHCALGMAKEGFDWIWCEHALTVGYRASLTEIVQIIGRATRDAPGKSRARFTNLIAEPDASEEAVTEAVNDTLKAIAASLLMEQVLAPRFNFTPKRPRQRAGRGLRLWRRTATRKAEVQCRFQ